MFTQLVNSKEAAKTFLPILQLRFGLTDISEVYQCEKGIVFFAKVGVTLRIYLYTPQGTLTELGTLPLTNRNAQWYTDENVLLIMQEDDAGVCIYTRYPYPSEGKRGDVIQWVTFSQPEVYNEPSNGDGMVINMSIGTYFSIGSQKEIHNCLFIGHQGVLTIYQPQSQLAPAPKSIATVKGNIGIHYSARTKFPNIKVLTTGRLVVLMERLPYLTAGEMSEQWVETLTWVIPDDEQVAFTMDNGMQGLEIWCGEENVTVDLVRYRKNAATLRFTIDWKGVGVTYPYVVKP